ncbi:uncharacterized protein LOC113231271 isoform X2 [Hyposmocoma kahamanoa]|uniref:uncharacterized protein LOC113231271 isoform X2 n=1 Tax=Hyposmocoma kahamanoa TaxID=1477025 RepID=UPI000E6D9496|nr:uncharacterized protein LOC113231271 isoform X2 [Hyposmocoma kahamanoa]
MPCGIRFYRWRGKRHHQESSKSSRSPSPEPSQEPQTHETFRPILRTPPPPSRPGPPPSPPVPTQPIIPVPPEPTGPQPLLPCPVCCRTFVPQSLSKHVKICEKMAVKKRKTFDSSRQRREGLSASHGVDGGTDLEQFLPKNFGLPENSPFLEKSPPNTAKATPKPKPVSVKTAIAKPSSELQRCPHCNRAFGVRAFERHVEWCADKAKILPAAPTQPPPHIADAKQRLNARTQYKAPPVRGRRSSQTRDKSNNSRSASVESSRGVSPPPPREYGDYTKQGRLRASESMSSNDHDESPHVPVIRNSRNSNTSGDANVKARQARLARDLSSSRNSQDIPIQQSTTDPNLMKSISPKKPKNKISIKKQQQLKKLEEIANKYNERQYKLKEKREKQNSAIEKKQLQDRSQIPIPKKLPNIVSKPKREVAIEKVPKIDTNDELNSPKPSTSKAKAIRHKPSAVKERAHIEVSDNKKIIKNATAKKDAAAKLKASTVSLDSLDVPLNVINEQATHSIGINTELMCPCVPCVIHDYVDPKPPAQKKQAERHEKDKEVSEIRPIEPKVELLYKNLTMVSSCDIQALGIDPDSLEDLSIKFDNKTLSISNETFNNSDRNFRTSEKNITSISDRNILDKTESLNEPKNNHETSVDIDLNVLQPNTGEEDNVAIKESVDTGNSRNTDKELEKTPSRDLSAEEYEDDYERDLSAEFDESAEDKSKGSVKNDIMCRHGSGDTYTKFTENPDDLEEFINMTDQMISNHNFNEDIFHMDKEIEKFHTPKTSSIETIAKSSSENETEHPEETKQKFSDTLEDLKTQLKELLDEAGNTIEEAVKETEKTNNIDDKRQVNDMEHITIYQLKTYEQRNVEEIKVTEDVPCEFRLPSIVENNKPNRKETCSRKKIQAIYKSNRNFKLLGEQSKSNKENKTFVKENHDENSDSQSITADAPPLKFPRIENKSSNNIVSETLFRPSSVIRSSSFLDSIQKKSVTKPDSGKIRLKSDQLEQDIMQSLKEFDSLYDTDRNDVSQMNKEINYNAEYGTAKRQSRVKTERKKNEKKSNGNFTPNGKSADSAYSSLNRISPSKLSVCNSKESNGVTLDNIPAGSDSSGCQKDDLRSMSSDEFLAMERSAELNEPLAPVEIHTSTKEIENPIINEKHVSSRASSRRSSTWRPRPGLSSSGSETSLHRPQRDSAPAPPPRLSRFCHECGSKFPVDTAKFCIECGVKRLLV